MKFFVLFSLFLSTNSHAQTGYTTGEVVANLVVKKILNYSVAASSLKKLQAGITIIDFFGTWCVPCIKALPELTNYKNKFTNDVNIFLVSNEREDKLTKFIITNQPFALPMVVDEENIFTNAFKPPSYPYTVVLDKNLKIVSITNAADLTESMLLKFIDEGKNIATAKIPELKNETEIKPAAKMVNFKESNNDVVKLSQHFIYAAKTNEDAGVFINQLKNLNYTELISNLKNDEDKKAFWINLYNAYTNASLHKNPGLYKNRSSFFKNKNIIVAGKILSLDKIEHGILRRSKIKWSLGYLNKLFAGKKEKQLRVNKLDYRIHFALNCGAKSCPPIAFYNPENLNSQLDIATNAYLKGETVYDKENNFLQLPALLSWFRRDFGGKKKIVTLIKQLQIIPVNSNPGIRFKKYDWSLYLDNYKN